MSDSFDGPDRVKVVDQLGSVINPASVEKQDQIISALSSLGGGGTFHTNEIYEDSGNTYFCKENEDGDWYVMKIDSSSVFTHASITNNSGVTSYASARLGVTGLTYGTFNEAF